MVLGRSETLLGPSSLAAESLTHTCRVVPRGRGRRNEHHFLSHSVQGVWQIPFHSKPRTDLGKRLV